MKKKVVLVIAIALITVTMCVMLVGCSPKNPVDFLDKWEKAEAKAYYTASAECLINGDTLIIKDKSIAGSEYTYIYEIVGDKFNCYMGIKEGSSPVVWEATTGSLSEYKEENGEDFTLMKVIETLVGNPEELKEIIGDVFDKSFAKKDEWYHSISEDLGEFYIKLSGKEMIIKEDLNSKKDYDMKYVIGCDKLEIPAQAKNALKK